MSNAITQELAKKKNYIIMDDSPHSDIWNKFLDSQSNGNLDQTYEYGEAIKKAHPGIEVLRLFAVDGASPVGLIQGHYQKKHGYGRDLTIGGSYGAAPVIALENRNEENMRVILQGLEKSAHQKHIVEGELKWPEKLGFQPVFKNLDYEVTSSYNVYVVPLATSLGDLWGKIHPNKRKNVKKAENAGVEVVCGQSERDFQSFVGMLKTSALRANFDPRITEIEEAWRQFSSKGSARIFLSKWKDQDVAGTFIITHGDTAFARAAGSLEDAWEVRPNDIVHWKAMEWASQQGYSLYNMGGVEYPEPHEGESGWGLWRWKREWRGTLERILVYSKVYLPTLRKLMDATRQTRKRFGL